jgi:PHD/YefM family antitoxin component YafN of YafNO toxin-antitoxin module
MLRLANICSLTEFRHNSKDFIQKMKESASPLVLTVNGRADVIVYEAQAFQAIVDRLEAAEAEILELRAQLEPPAAAKTPKKTPQ